MPLNCGIEGGIDVNCDDLRKPGGLSREAWGFNLSDLTAPLPVELAAYVTNIPLATYRGLYKFAGTKFSHEFTWTEQTSDGGNKSYQQSLTLRLFNSNPTDDSVIEDLSVADTVFVVRTNAGEFLILGAENGLTSEGSTGGAGRQAVDATTSQIVLIGTERFLPKRLLIGGSAAATLQYLNSATV
jgi:hypothetical protein